MSLRAWQARAVDAALEHLNDRPVVSAIMGAGKSIAIAELARRLRADHDIPIIVSVPTQQLVRQQAAAMERWLGCEIGQWYADAKDFQAITVACHNSLSTLPELGACIWIADECHKTECDDVKAWALDAAPTYRVGFTATPYRADWRESVSLFDRLVCEYQVQDALIDGVIVPPRLHQPEHGGSVDAVCADWIASRDGVGAVNARSIDDAEAFAAMLIADYDIDARVVHSRRSREQNAEVLGWLSTAQSGCAVYVNMLAEGFNEPNLRWLCLRRNVGSRVRFAQEVGRGLRAAPGKTVCDIFDPFDLFDRHSLSWQECLGDPPEVVPQEPWARDALGVDAADMDQEQMAIVIGHAARWLRRTILDWQLAGLLEIKVKSTSWRGKLPSEKQVALMRSLGRRFASVDAPDDVLEHMRACYRLAPHLSMGAVSDMIGIMMAATKRGVWPGAWA